MKKSQMIRAKKLGMSCTDIAKMKEVAKREAEKTMQIATEKAFLRMLAIPILILAEDNWKDKNKVAIPEFIEDVMSFYESIEMGIVTEKQLADTLKEMAGIEIEAEWLENKKKGNENV